MHFVDAPMSIVLGAWYRCADGCVISAQTKRTKSDNFRYRSRRGDVSASVSDKLTSEICDDWAQVEAARCYL